MINVGACPLIHPNYFSIYLGLGLGLQLGLGLGLIQWQKRISWPKNNSGELTDKYLNVCVTVQSPYCDEKIVPIFKPFSSQLWLTAG